MKNEPFDIPDCRLRAKKILPYLTKLVMSLSIVETKGLRTFAVDKHGRMYFDPAMLQKWSFTECATVILHECLHIMLNHVKRALSHLPAQPTQEQWYRWNIAADCVVNQMLRFDADNRIAPKLPDGAVNHEEFGLPGNLATEEYYELLEDNQQFQQLYWMLQPYLDAKYSGRQYTGERSVGQDGEGDMPDGMLVIGGSAADGQQRPWEHGDPNDNGKSNNGEETPHGLSKHDQTMLRRHIAREISEEYAGKSRGSISHYAEAFIEEILKPRVNPLEEFRACLRYARNTKLGRGQPNYRRIARRCPRDTFIPAQREPVPYVTLIIDTSGSMSDKELALCLGTAAEVLRGLEDRLRVLAGDTDVKTAQTVFSASSIELIGRGGTDMSVLMEAAAREKPAPNVIIVCTDGETPWPEKELGPLCIAALTQAEPSYAEVPEWMEKVILK